MASPINPSEQLGLIYDPNHDTLIRPSYPCTSTQHHNSLPDQPIFTQDIPLNASHRTWLRLYTHSNPHPNTKLPLIIYFHASGFIICSADISFYHDFCTSMAISLPAVVLSVGYRLAPENRLPAAYEDAFEAIEWVRNEGEKWFDDTVDFSSCYLMGTSAGGNIVYRAGLRASSMELSPLVIQGLILHHPFFGGVERTHSEERLCNNPVFPLAYSDLMWELSLPKGADRDHEFCNPMVKGNSEEKTDFRRWFVSVYGGDTLMDKVKEFAKMLEGKGASVMTWFEEEGYHAMELTEPQKAPRLLTLLKQFVYSSRG